MNGFLTFVLWAWLIAGIGILERVFGSGVPFGTAFSKGAPIIGIWATVGAVAGAWLFLLHWIATEEERDRLRGFVERRDNASSEDLRLAAPEAYLLLNEGEVKPAEVFKAGILQAVAAGRLLVGDGSTDLEAGPDWEPTAIRSRQTAEGAPIFGSAAVLAGDEGVRATTKECVIRIKEEYGNPEGFVEREVEPRLRDLGYWTTEFGITGSGRQAKSILEGRVGAALYDMEARGGLSIDGDPWKALLAALVMVSSGLAMREAEQGAIEVNEAHLGGDLSPESDVTSDLMTWMAFDAFDNILSGIDSAVSDGGFDGGDGGDGGDGDSGGGE